MQKARFLGLFQRKDLKASRHGFCANFDGFSSNQLQVYFTELIELEKTFEGQKILARAL